MRVIRVDRRVTALAMVAGLCLLLPTQQKPFRWTVKQARLIAQWSGLLAPAAPPAPERSEASVAPVAAPPSGVSAGHDLTGAAEALRLYREGRSEEGDAALTTADPLVRGAVEWAFLRDHPVKAGVERISAFMRAHPDWPLTALRKAAEDLSGAENARRDRVAAYYAEFPAISPAGAIASADLDRDDAGLRGAAIETVRRLWREGELTTALEKRLLKTFGAVLTPADHIFRANRLLEREQAAAAARAAMLAGKDGEALFRAESDLFNDAPWSKVAAKVPAALRDDPGLLFARIHALRHAGHIEDAARLMLSAPREAERLASPDDWWIERRLIARKLLDAGDARRAYEIVSAHAAASEEARVEAEFHAGWIALRFLGDAALAAPHFERLTELAHEPHAVARAWYWRGRLEEAQGGDGKQFYARAANARETFYGQLARVKLGQEAVALRAPVEAAQGEARAAPVRAAELLFALNETEAARRLALSSVAVLDAPEQMAALSEVIERQGDAHAALVAGKEALRRGIAIDSLGWPVNGVPEFPALANSAARPLVLAIARQESAFQPAARSGANAFGLMQMLEGTARTAAQHAGLAFDEDRLKNDPAFNARLGAIHLGQLLSEYNGSHVLAFAAYNAGGGNVRDWIKAYGDPRKPGVDPIDWIERIPFTETRNYVQRIVENLHIYRARLGDDAENLFASDLRQTMAEN